MPSLVLGPLLRHAGERDATIWVQTSEPCEVEVLGSRARTFCVAGHHFALVVVEGLEPGAVTPYEVRLDGERVWPALDGWPASVIRTIAPEDPVELVFGSCRTAYPHEPPYTLTKDADPRGREVCALRALAERLAAGGPERLPGALLMLGDQIYADETEPDTQEFIRRRRDAAVPPRLEVGGFEEYVHAYGVAWGEDAIRWLLSTVPTAMIFDDHDVIDDWNTSRDWIAAIRAQGWWDERIVGAFMSYWIFQHLGNLSPQALATDDLWQQVRQSDDAEDLLREFAWRADRTASEAQWSFSRDIGPARLVMVDSRAARVLDPDGRAMVDDAEWRWIERAAAEGGRDHLLIGTSLPWLLAPGMHHLEAASEPIGEGAWGRPAAWVAERLRRALDLEHWAAFGASFERMTSLVARVGGGAAGANGAAGGAEGGGTGANGGGTGANGGGAATAPATIVALSGDVHHAYLAEVAFPRSAGVRSRVYQAVASPLRNPLDSRERRVIRAMSTRAAAAVTRALARRAGVPEPRIRWRLREPAVFDNVVATLRLHGRDAALRIERARVADDDRVRLETAFQGTL